MTVSDDSGTYRASLGAAAAAIRGASSVALACHVHPDGDALGSMLALHHVLAASGIESVASFPEPFVIAPHYRELVGLECIRPPHEFPTAPDVMVTFDCGSLDRLGGFVPAARAARELIVIDHHVSNDRYGTINVIEPTAAASGVVVRDLVAALGLELNRAAAVCLYTALVCDTGRFQYDSTTPAVFELAAELTAFDVPVSALSRSLFEEHRFAYLQLLAAVVQRAELDLGSGLVWTAIRQHDLEAFDVTMEEVEGLIDILRRTKEADVSVVLKEDADGSVRVSMRSLGRVDVCAIAQHHGGGGHRFAAGFTSHTGVDATIAAIRSAL